MSATGTAALEWTVSGHGRRLLTVAVLAVLASVLSRDALVLCLAGPPLLLLLAGGTAPRPHEVRLEVDLAPERCLEGDEVVLRLCARTGTPGVVLTPMLTPSRRLREVARHTTHDLREGGSSTTWRLRVVRWGRWSVGPVQLQVCAPGRLWRAAVAWPAGELIAYPRPAELASLLLPRDLLPRPGTHPARTLGSGLQLHDLRPYTPGDRLRDIHWPSSSRHRELIVVQRMSELAADVVVAVDAFSDVAGSLERSMRGCAGVARAYLGAGDRVGLAVLGGSLRTLRPESGQRMLYRIADAVLAVRRDDSVVGPDVARVAPRDLPRHSLVVLFSPLLDERALSTVQDLHTRGSTVVVIDVLTTEPALSRRPARDEALVLRLWRLDREAGRRRLADHGIRSLRWPPDRSLEEVLGPLARPRRSAVPR